MEGPEKLGVKHKNKVTPEPKKPLVLDQISQASSAAKSRISQNSHESVVSNIVQSSHESAQKTSGTDRSLGSINFFGYSITSKIGLSLYKSVSIILPLIPTFALIVQNAIMLEDMVRKSTTLDQNYVQQVSANSLSVLASKLQDERYNAIFDILMSRYVPSKALT